MNFKDLKILLVEDNKINMMLTRKLIEKTGCHTEIAYSGLEALELLREHQFECILTDIQMPLMDGLEFAKKAREMGVVKTPIIAMTGYIGDEEIKATTAAGMNGILTKPFGIEELASIIQKFCVDQPK